MITTGKARGTKLPTFIYFAIDIIVEPIYGEPVPDDSKDNLRTNLGALVGT